MRIDPVHNLVTGLDLRETNAERQPAAKSTTTPQETPQGDRVDLSLVSELSKLNSPSLEAASVDQVGLPAERLAEIQNRLKSGHYASEQALGRSADGILELFAS